MTNEDITRLVLAALFGAGASFIATSVKAVRDEHRDVCNEFGAALLKVADLASEYWLEEADSAKLSLLQTRVMGGQAYLARYRVFALEWFSKADRKIVEERLADFYEALTGGDFKGAGRAVDPHRAELCQVLAAEVAVITKASNARSLTIRAQVLRLVRWEMVSNFAQDQFRWTRPNP